ncbi:hypothetical protein AN644_01370 [Candidatus Epulonipiscium fishelsonii]|nr:hypothetical protein AN644_01370 [Epulopiscium sp. SCG-C06WGA-EpuloA1]
MKEALLVIDPQVDYLSYGKYPLWNIDTTLKNIETAIRRALKNEVPVILTQHVAQPEEHSRNYPFIAGTDGVELVGEVLDLIENPIILTKEFRNAFFQTTLEEVLTNLQTTNLIVAGMMTHSCIIATITSGAAQKYNISVISDCCTSMTEEIHLNALEQIKDLKNVDLIKLSEF